VLWEEGVAHGGELAQQVELDLHTHKTGRSGKRSGCFKVRLHGDKLESAYSNEMAFLGPSDGLEVMVGKQLMEPNDKLEASHTMVMI
jgi:hypothetical protein